jgi:hypothetical protein
MPEAMSPSLEPSHQGVATTQGPSSPEPQDIDGERHKSFLHKLLYESYSGLAGWNWGDEPPPPQENSEEESQPSMVEEPKSTVCGAIHIVAAADQCLLLEDYNQALIERTFMLTEIHNWVSSIFTEEEKLSDLMTSMIEDLEESD